MKRRIHALVYALPILLNAIVAIWWGALMFAVVRQHHFAFGTGDLSLFIVPVAATLAVVALILRLHN